MASRKTYFPSQIQFSTSFNHRFEFHESDLWNYSEDLTTLISPPSPEPHQASPAPPRSRKIRSVSRKPSQSNNSGPSSLPVNIPDWSKILGEDVEADVAELSEEEDDDVDDRVPPHEYAARQLARRSGMAVAFSVQEGVGRTLKGRDLRRVRNAIWKQTGFED